MQSRLLLLLPLFASMANAAEPTQLEIWQKKMAPIVPRNYVCQHTATPVKIDGKLDDAAWADAPWTDDFVDIEGDAKPKPKFRTRAKMLWDDEYLYIAAELEEPHVWGTITKHDEVIFNDPDFEVFIDPDGDTHEYYEFEMNALNTGWDLFLGKPYKDGGPAKNEWDIPGLKTGVHVRGTINHPADIDEGWSVEIAFPWKVLAEFANRPAPPQEGDQWRLGFSRVEWQIEVKDGKYVKVPNTPENNWIWSAQGVIDMHRPEKWGYVQFTKKAPGTVKFVPDPAAPVRDILMGVYYAQRDFHKKNGRWAKEIAELDFPADAKNPYGTPTLRVTPDGYEAILGVPRAGAEPENWVIRQDSRVRRVK